MNENLIKILDKLKKLFALTQSPNENEAATAARTAQALIHKHRLSDMLVESLRNGKLEIDREEVINFLDVGITLFWVDREIETWEGQLATVVCEANGCVPWIGKAQANGKESRYIGIVGTLPDGKITMFLFHYLFMEIMRLSMKEENQTKDFLRGFKGGAVNKIQERLFEGLKEAEEQFKSESAGISIVHIDDILGRREKRIEKAKEKLKSDWLTAPSERKSDENVSLADLGAGIAAGTEAAKTIDLHQNKKFEKEKKRLT